ncbi:radical SAM protein [Geotalea toluenoxydans]
MKNYNFEGHKLAYHLDRVNEYLTSGDCFPIYMEISPVGSCNHRCIFCAYDFIGYPNRRLETGRALTFIDELAEAGLKSLLFAGEGEPLLHPDCAAMVRRARSNGIDVGLFTNGQLLTPQLAEEILPHLTFVRFSFNGGTPDTYARIHQVKPEVFATVVGALKHAAAIRKSNFLATTIGAQFVLLPENLASLQEAAAIIKDAGADYLAIKPFVQQSSRQGYQMQQIEPALLEDCLAAAEAVSRDHFRVIARRDSFSGYGQRRYRRCFGTSFISVVNSAGEVASCLPYWDRSEYVFGSIYERPFREIWQGEKRQRIKEHLEQLLDVATCPPNCRPNAVNDFLYDIRYPSVEHVNFI